MSKTQQELEKALNEIIRLRAKIALRTKQNREDNNKVDLLRFGIWRSKVLQLVGVSDAVTYDFGSNGGTRSGTIIKVDRRYALADFGGAGRWKLNITHVDIPGEAYGMHDGKSLY